MIYNKKLTLNSLLVKHQHGNRDWEKIVPSSHNRKELRHDHPSIQRRQSENQGVISVLDSPGREAFLYASSIP